MPPLAIFAASLSGLAAAGTCSIHRVVPADPHAHTVATTQAPVARDSIVQRRPELDCSEGVGVRILSWNPVYTSEATTLEPGAHTCVDPQVLQSVDQLSFLVSWPPPRERAQGEPTLQPGTIVPPVSSSPDCNATHLAFGDLSLPVDSLHALRPVDDPTLDGLLRLQAHAIRRFGPLGLETIGFTHTGRYSLPWTHWDSAEELAHTWQTEHLDTETRKERAVVASGPQGVYLYFKGADPVRTDVWGTEATIHALIDTLADWHDHCATLPEATAATCAVQLGDISYTSDLRPDPLGHRDHYLGTCVDIRLFRADGSRYEAWWNRPDDRPAFADRPGYSRPLTAAFIAHLLGRNDVDRVLFNDPDVPGATPAKGHDDHLHVCFAAPS